MAMIVLYKVSVDTESFEDAGNYVGESTHFKYKKPLYTESLIATSYIRARYGDKFVVIETAELDIDWKPVV